MTALDPAVIRILTGPRRRLRVLLAFVLTAVLASMPLPMAGAFLWVMAAAYMGLTETAVRMLGEQHRAQRLLEAEHDGHTRLLAQRDARIIALEADLVRARSASTVRPETAEQAIFRKVGLHPGAPEFLVLAAQKAFRLALHPDRHPRHQLQAHDRYLAAQAVFEQIAKLRA